MKLNVDSFRRTKIVGNRPPVVEFVEPKGNVIELSEKLQSELNRLYNAGIRRERLANFAKKFGIGAGIYIGLNIVLGVGLLVATVLGYDVIGWYTELLGVSNV